jgi:hypothetical protein
MVSKPFGQFWLSLLLAVSLGASPAGAQQVRFSETAWLDFAYLIDIWAQAARPVGGGPTDGLEGDAFVNLSRLVIRGQVLPRVGFLVATGGDRDFGSFEVWDAVVYARLGSSLTVDAGRVVLPFVRHAQQFSNDLQTHDFQRTAFMYPRGSTTRRRDEGVRVRGLAAGGAVDYRLAVTRGLETRQGVPRFTGRVGVNGGRAEPGYVLPGTYLSGPAVLAVGVALDIQPDVVVGGGAYRAVGGDAFWSLPVGEADRFAGQTALVRYRGLNGLDPEGRPVVVDRTGVGGVFNAAYLFRAVGPVVAVEWFRPEGASGVDDHLLAAHLGLNWWLRGTAASLKLHGGLRKERGVSPGDADPVITLQLLTRLPFPARPDQRPRIERQ